MADYTMRADGTAANKAAALDGDPAVQAECMSVATHNAETFSAGDAIQLADTGGIYRAKVIVPSSGSVGSPITYEEYSGDAPLLYGSTELTSAALKWTASGSGVNEYYCELAGSGDPSLDEPDLVVFHDADPANVVQLVDGTLGALADHESGYGDNDALGFLTVYVRDDTGDPDVSGVTIEASQRGCFLVSSKNYVTVDGLTFKYGIDPEGGLRSDGCSYLIVQNCEAYWNNGHGIGIKNANSTIDSCTAGYNGGHNLLAGGNEGSHATGMTIKNSIAHHGINNFWSGWDGYGIKFLFVDDSEILNCESYLNELQGIDLDGTTGEGSYRCRVSGNFIHDNVFQGILVEVYSDDCEIDNNLLIDNCTSNNNATGEIAVTNCLRTLIYSNLVYRTKAGGHATGRIVYIQDLNPGRVGGGTVLYGNTFDTDGQGTRCVEIDGYYSCENVKIKDNIMVGASDPCLKVASVGENYDGFEVDYNRYLRSDADPDVIRRQSVKYTIVEHFAAFGDDENSTVGAPGFTDQANQDYTLAVAAACIDTGVKLLGGFERGLRPESTWPSGVSTADHNSYGAGRDIGAFVYTAGTAKRTTITGAGVMY